MLYSILFFCVIVEGMLPKKSGEKSRSLFFFFQICPLERGQRASKTVHFTINLFQVFLDLIFCVPFDLGCNRALLMSGRVGRLPGIWHAKCALRERIENSHVRLKHRIAGTVAFCKTFPQAWCIIWYFTIHIKAVVLCLCQYSFDSL